MAPGWLVSSSSWARRGAEGHPGTSALSTQGVQFRKEKCACLTAQRRAIATGVCQPV